MGSCREDFNWSFGKIAPGALLSLKRTHLYLEEISFCKTVRWRWIGWGGTWLCPATPGPWASFQAPFLLTVQHLHAHEPARVKPLAGIGLWTCPNGTEFCSMRTCCFWIIGDERERNRIICKHPRFLNEKYTKVTVQLAFSFFFYKYQEILSCPFFSTPPTC